MAARDGKSYSGRVELQPGGHVLIVASSGAAVTLPFDKVARFSVADAPVVPAAPARRDAGLPLPWRQDGVGQLKEPGTSSEESGVFTVRGAGWGIWGAADSFQFVSQPLVGEGEVIARLGVLPSEENPFVAGLTMRESFDPRSPQAAVMMFPEGGLRMSCRPVDGSAESAPPSGNKPWQWVRLVRAGDSFSGFCSADGQAWTLVGTVRVQMKAEAQVGLACAATLNQGLAGATFDHVKVTALPSGPAEGLGLVDGSIVAGRARILDAQGLKYTDPAGVERRLPAEAVAYVFTRPLPPDVRAALAARPEGVSFVTGDAMEGAVQGLGEGRVTVSSLMVGRQTPPLSKVVTVVLRPVKPRGGASVSTRDGSVYRCQSVIMSDGVVTAQGGAAGDVTVKAASVTAVDRAGS